MKVVFIGVGDAFDECQTNTSILIDSLEKKILLDCGFTTPKSLFRLVPEADNIDVVLISHFHGDHFFGIPYLLGHMRAAGRTVPLTILGPAGVEKKVLSAIDLAYPSLRSKLDFELDFKSLNPGHQIFISNFEFECVTVKHSGNAIATKMKSNNFSIYYSGDGIPGDDALKMAHGCNLVIHESWGISKGSQSHFSAKDCLNFAHECGCSKLALVHVYAKLRYKLYDLYKTGMLVRDGVDVFVPVQGDVLDLS